MESTQIKYEMTQNASKNFQPQPLASRQIKPVMPITFSQRFHQSQAIEIAEEYERAIDSNSLEDISILLEKVLELTRG